MAFWAYMLRCADGHYYIGHTDNLDHRIGQHPVRPDWRLHPYPPPGHARVVSGFPLPSRSARSRTPR
ncbi:GIY-YIG nuclease family protein [Sphingomonas sp. PWP1-2]|uniref:GIY-YIG nuclease family protein n=1 Tax=Sphingomonas sp. PWP1-2 TaxID=2804558 RepID=UPI003CF77A25